MYRIIDWHRKRSLLLLLLGYTSFFVHSAQGQPGGSALSSLSGAESRFIPPAESWFYGAQDALRAEMQVVGSALERQGAAYAEPWKHHLRWAQLERNLVALGAINLAEIELARRWMFSNRKGLELPFYEKLRELTDDYLSAAYTLSQPDLKAQFNEHVLLVREQVENLITNPTDANAAALGRTLGWFELTRQLTSEVEQLRSLLSHPNAQVLVGKRLVRNIMSTQSPQVEHTLPVSDRSEAPPTRRLQRPRTVHVRGTAQTIGTISLEIVPNTRQAELSIIYRGQVDSHCRADAGPVSFNIRTIGPMSASVPVTFDPTGIHLGTTSVVPEVRTTVTNITGNNELVRRIGTRRVNDPQNRSFMSARARSKAVELLEDEMDTRVGKAIDDIRAEIARMRTNASEFGEVFAPVIREGAAPYFQSAFSLNEVVGVNIQSERREQFGAATPCPMDFAEGDVRVRVHVSFLNNMMETIMAGKTFTDEYFMKYAKVLQPTLPLDLMVHSRASRWAIVAAKPRPLEMSIPAPNKFQFAFHIASLEVDGKTYSEPTTATVRYELVKNEFDEFFLQRSANVEIDSTLSEKHREFLNKKLSAFFAPVLDGGGVIVPEGGSIGSLNMLKFLGVKADQDWLVVGIDVPKEFVEKAMESTGEASVPSAAPIEANVLPPPFAVDEELSSYPTGLDRS